MERRTITAQDILESVLIPHLAPRIAEAIRQAVADAYGVRAADLRLPPEPAPVVNTH